MMTAREAFSSVKHPKFEKTFRSVIGEKRTDLIAREQIHRAAGGPDCHPHPVAIRIGRNDQIGALPFRQLDAEPQRRRVFRVGGVDGGKISIEAVLFFHDSKVETKSLEHRFDDDATCAVQWRENNSKRLGGADQLLVQDQTLEATHVGLVDFAAEHAHFTALAPWGPRPASRS